MIIFLIISPKIVSHNTFLKNISTTSQDHIINRLPFAIKMIFFLSVPLRLKPIVGHFFNNLIESYCKVSHDDNLCFLNYGPGDSGYLAILNIEKRNTHDTIKVFVELTPKFFYKRSRLTRSLIDRDVLKEPALGEYSYAIFNNGILIQRVGKYFYNFDINHYSNPVTKISFFNKNN